MRLDKYSHRVWYITKISSLNSFIHSLFLVQKPHLSDLDGELAEMLLIPHVLVCPISR